MPAIPAADATTSARMHVERLAPAWGVSAGAMPKLESLGEIPILSGTIVRFRQVIDGMPIDPSSGGELHVMVGKDGALLAASGKLVASNTPHPKAVTFVDDDAGAVARAVGDLYKTNFAPTSLAMAELGSDGARRLGGQSGLVNVSRSRAQQAWYPDGKVLTPAWIVEAYSSSTTGTDGDAYRTVISADGRVLARTNLKADAKFNYRVFAETTGELHPIDGPLVDVTPNATGVPNTTPYPAYILPNLVTVDGLNHPGGSATPDPWLANGRTETIGNNVEAYTDENPPDGLTFGDFRATITATGTFDRTFDTSLGALSSQGQQMAGITSLFYLINWLHDFWYDAGFTEAAGNAQNSNLGRGGQDRDALLAEAQDNALGPNGGSRNNANMSTPSDGLPPRMQVFVWDGKADRSLAISNRTPPTGPASFGLTAFTTTAPVVLANDGDASNGGSTSDACTALTTPATGKIVLLDRGICSFKTKVLNAQNAGAVGVILANNAASAAPPTLGDDATITTAITIGAVSVLQTEGDAIKADLVAAGATPVNATIHRGASGPDLEGTLDATVISHEFGHYVHHRLSVCNTTLCGAMSEGWADFDALLVTSRAGDDFTKAFPVGVYSTQSFAADPVYYGIRRAPYSTNHALNPLLFHHMSNGQALPPPPFNGGPTTGNSEVHNGGEVWASMLWEGYAALQQQPGAVFETVRRNMQKYVVAGLLLSPTDNTPTEMRDAILAAVHTVSPTDHDILAAAYAQRGFGSCAVSPPRNSTDFVGIVDDNQVKGRLAAGVLTMQTTKNCDQDSVLDAGETARITVPVSNPGPAALSNVAVTLTSATSGVHIMNATAAMGTLGAYSNTTATFDVQLDNTVTTVLAGDFTVKFAADNGCSAPADLPFSIPLNADDKPASSATDTFDAIGSVWNPTAGTALWAHNRKSTAALDGLWNGADANATSDASLESPALTGGAGSVSVTFEHRFSFEGTPAQPFDGGVIEYTTDGGTTWQDVSGISNPGYNTTLVATGTNPLAGRQAFGVTSTGYPATSMVTLNFGNNLSNKTFKLRFRVGSDTDTGAPGWDIDNVAFTGIVGTPFPTLVADTGTCTAGGPDAGPGPGPDAGSPPDAGNPETGGGGSNSGGCCQTGGSGTGSAGLALGVLAMLLRRRRR